MVVIETAAVDVNDNVDFEYELYQIGSNQAARSSSNVVSDSVFNTLASIEQEALSLPPMPVISVQPNLHDLNQMLKSMILPNKSNNKFPNNKMVDDNEEDEEEEEDDDKSQAMDKKAKIKQNLENFCLFIQSSGATSNGENLEVHERNSIQILNNSCLKSNCNLEFELRLRSAKTKMTTTTMKTTISGREHILESSEQQPSSDTESTTKSDDDSTVKRYKCKCLINGVKIASSHASTKIEAKRLAALKSIKCLIKIFPAIKETNYQSSLNFGDVSSTAPQNATAPTAKYFKISKEDLFKGLIPPTLFESSQFGSSNCMASSSLGYQLNQLNQSQQANIQIGTNYSKISL
jgi:hypothetical protein